MKKLAIIDDLIEKILEFLSPNRYACLSYDCQDIDRGDTETWGTCKKRFVGAEMDL